MSCPELLNRLHDFRRDFNTINRWKFPKLSPAPLQKWLNFNLGQVDYAEFRTRRMDVGPKAQSPLGKSMSVYVLLVFVGLLLLLFPSFGIPFAAAWYLAMFIAIAHDAVRSARWRRESEVSIVRVIRSSRKVK